MFTGAVAERAGCFELAHGGTLFLDEIGTLSLDHQAKLLRVLQSGELTAVGSNKTKQVDVRIVSATNASLTDEVAAGRFREDLLYRLNTVEIRLPPLRERENDVVSLASAFLATKAARYKKTIGGFAPDAAAALLAHPWPGNVRELEHVVERAVVLADGDEITCAELDLGARSRGAGAGELDTGAGAAGGGAAAATGCPVETTGAGAGVGAGGGLGAGAGGGEAVS